jgi:Major capsid protein N-terminus
MDGYNTMIGNTSELTTASASGGSIPGATLYIPFQFWFNRNAGLALPLIALQYHEVKFNLSFNPASQCYIGTAAATPSIGYASLWIDYVYLDTDERRQFAQVQHEYLLL